MSSLLLSPINFADLDITQQEQALVDFVNHITHFYQQEGRVFPWRESYNPYEILVSEIMLQQTQTSRVEPKYVAFIVRWPTLEALSQASLSEVLAFWQGLGYPRRALALLEIAKRSAENGYQLRLEIEYLRTLPQVGEATAAALLAFCSNAKSIYLETNIRRALIYHFCANEERVADSTLKEMLGRLVELVPDRRLWYYALMDYGVYLRQVGQNPNQRSRHYVRQSPYENSNRKLRGQILQLLLQHGELSLATVAVSTNFSPKRIEEAFASLTREGFIEQVGEKEPHYRICNVAEDLQ